MNSTEEEHTRHFILENKDFIRNYYYYYSGKAQYWKVVLGTTFAQKHFF